LGGRAPSEGNCLLKKKLGFGQEGRLVLFVSLREKGGKGGISTPMKRNKGFLFNPINRHKKVVQPTDWYKRMLTGGASRGKEVWVAKSEKEGTSS